MKKPTTFRRKRLRLVEVVQEWYCLPMHSFRRHHLIGLVLTIFVGLPLTCRAMQSSMQVEGLCHAILASEYPPLESVLKDELEWGRIFGRMSHSLVGRLSDQPQEAAQQVREIVRFLLVWRGANQDFAQAQAIAYRASADTLKFLNLSSVGRHTVFSLDGESLVIDLRNGMTTAYLTRARGYGAEDRVPLKAVLDPLKFELESVETELPLLSLADETPASLIDWLAEFAQRAQFTTEPAPWSASALKTFETSIWPVIFSNLKWLKSSYPAGFQKILLGMYFQLRNNSEAPLSVEDMRARIVSKYPTITFRHETFDVGPLFDELIEEAKNTDFNFSVPLEFTDSQGRHGIINAIVKGRVDFSSGFPHVIFSSEGFPSENWAPSDRPYKVILATDARHGKWINTHDLNGILQALVSLSEVRKNRRLRQP